MAGISKLYVIGKLGGFQGADGVNPILMQIWVGDGSRQWLEPHYVEPSIKPIGKLRSLVPQSPDDADSLIDACIAFYPQHFKRCPSLGAVESQLSNETCLDFHMGQDKIPTIWNKLREEAMPYFEGLHIFEAKLQRIGLQQA